MIPRLYEENETAFTSNGICPLPDATVCHVNEVLNGLYELYMSYPFDGKYSNELVKGRLIMAKPNDTANPQPFRIYKVTEQSQGKKYIVNAQHISYDLGGYPVAPFTATGVTPALTGLVSNSMVTNPFSVWTDISNTDTVYTQNVPQSFRACLGGTQGSILQRFRGELEWDKFTVKLHAHRGSDNGVTIRYGKNLETFENIRTNEASYTGCIAYWADSDGGFVSGTIQNIPDVDSTIEKIYVLDASSDFDEQPTSEELDARALQYIQDNELGLPFKDTLTVSFIALWQTEEYKNIAALERVSMGDTVHIVYRSFNVSMEVVEYIYDVLAERYTEIKLGKKSSSLSSTIRQIATDSQQDVVGDAVSMLQGAIDHAADVIAGGTGGYIVIGRNASGQPNEIYIMDSPDMGTAINVMRMNYAGIAFSNTGINGTYTTAWTIDSNFVADFITAGTINGNLIQAGSILTSALEVAVQSVIEGAKLNFSFLNDGLHIAQKDSSGNIISAYQSLFTELGMRVIDSNGTATLIAEEDTVTASNLTADQYLRIRATDVSSRFQQFYSTVHSEYEFGVFWEVV